MNLSDLNGPLIHLWKTIQRHPRTVAERAQELFAEYGNDKAKYLEAREHFNDSIGLPSNDNAALMLYLNAHCFNGLWRENAAGKINVPFGDVKSPSAPDGNLLYEVSGHLRQAQIAKLDYRHAFRLAVRGDGMFLDPPYHDGFSDYCADGFSDDDQRELAEKLKELASRGVKIWATNANTELIRKWYSWASIEEVDEGRSIAAKSDRRKAAACVLIRG